MKRILPYLLILLALVVMPTTMSCQKSAHQKGLEMDKRIADQHANPQGIAGSVIVRDITLKDRAGHKHHFVDYQWKFMYSCYGGCGCTMVNHIIVPTDGVTDSMSVAYMAVVDDFRGSPTRALTTAGRNARNISPFVAFAKKTVGTPTSVIMAYAHQQFGRSPEVTSIKRSYHWTGDPTNTYDMAQFIFEQK
jgi:hypothetical protein